MRKGQLKKKVSELEDLHIERRQALGELVLDMHVRDQWDEQRLRRGTAEVAAVEDDLTDLRAQLEGGSKAEAAPAPETAEHELRGAGGNTGEHATGEHTGEYATGEHTGEHTAEHLIAAPGETGEADTVSGAEPPTEAHPTPPGPPAGSEAEPPAEQPSEELAAEGPPTEEREVRAQLGYQAGGSRRARRSPTTEVGRRRQEPEAKPDPEAPSPSKPAAGAEAESTPKPDPDAPATVGAAAKAAKAEAGAGAAAEASQLDLLEQKIEQSERQARVASDAARAAAENAKGDEMESLRKELGADRSRVESALKDARAKLADAESRAQAADERRVSETGEAEAKLARQTAITREAAATWVRDQVREIQADAVLAEEVAAEPTAADAAAPDATAATAAAASAAPEASGGSGRPDERIAALEEELRRERASKQAALKTAEERLSDIEAEAVAAERRVEEAERHLREESERLKASASGDAGEAAVAGAAAAAAADSPAPAAAGAGGMPAGQAAAGDQKVREAAQAREAAATWLRGQIAALRLEIVKERQSARGGRPSEEEETE